MAEPPYGDRNRRFDGRVVVVVGAGQTPGSTIGNGRAAALCYAREGGRVLAVDRDLASAAETCDLIEADGGVAAAFRADVTSAVDCTAVVAEALRRWDRIDVLHNNVGIGTGDSHALAIEEPAWDVIHEVNLKGTWLMCKAAIPELRRLGGGVIVNISSIAAVCAAPLVAYKVSKAGVNALTHALAMENASHGIRVNAVMPGLIDTPMAIEGLSQALSIQQQDLRAIRDKSVPLRRKQGTAWDVANAALFLASDEASFITGAILPVDGGQSSRVG